MAFHRGPKIVTDGLVLYLDAANIKSYPGSGNIWYDMSSNKFIGQFENTPVYDEVDKSISFDGVSSIINLGDDDRFTLSSGFSFDFWFRTNVLTQSTIIEKYQSSGREYVAGINNNKLILTIFDQTAVSGANINLRIENLSNYITTDDYFHGVTTYDGTNDPNGLNIYINGVQMSGTAAMVNTFESIKNTSTSLTLAKSNPGLGGSINGNLSQIKIYDRALTPGEVLQNFNATKTRFGL